MGQNADIAEWLMSMGIVGVEDYVRPVIAFHWMKVIYIDPRWMIQHHILELGPW